jgi:K+-sensing histidine kinase KdpD
LKLEFESQGKRWSNAEGLLAAGVEATADLNQQRVGAANEVIGVIENVQEFS